jgi:glycyl-tRNA synthetase beta chain
MAGAIPVFGDLINNPTQALLAFMQDRLAVLLREQGYTALEVDAILSLEPPRLGDIPARLAAVRAFTQLPESPSLAAANKRVCNILKKASDFSEVLSVNVDKLLEPAEKAL